jgi:hypothetical protein
MIDIDSLPWMPLEATSGFPENPCIYFAVDVHGVIQYIGRSGNVRGRWKNHHRYQDLAAIGGIKIACMFVDRAQDLPQKEAELIRKFKPRLNNLRQSKSIVISDRPKRLHPDVAFSGQPVTTDSKDFWDQLKAIQKANKISVSLYPATWYQTAESLAFDWQIEFDVYESFLFSGFYANKSLSLPKEGLRKIFNSAKKLPSLTSRSIETLEALLSESNNQAICKLDIYFGKLEEAVIVANEIANMPFSYLYFRERFRGFTTKSR